MAADATNLKNVCSVPVVVVSPRVSWCGVVHDVIVLGCDRSPSLLMLAIDALRLEWYVERLPLLRCQELWKDKDDCACH